MLKINGISIPTPSTMTVGVMDITDATRNARGNLIAEIITTKRKLNLSYKYLTSSQLSTLLKAIEPMFFQVEYIDPVIGGWRTGTFYVGDRNVEVFTYVNENIRYKNITFNFIER